MKVFIADDNKDFCTTIEDIVNSFGYETETVQDPNLVIEKLDTISKDIGLLLLDIEFGPSYDKNGLDILKYSRRNYPEIPVIMISGKGSIDTAVRATKLGAVNFIEKSIISINKIKEVLESATARFNEHGNTKEIRRFLEMNGIMGLSDSMIQIGDDIIRYGRTDLNVMITGETGTGKKLVAQALHSISRRNKFSFVTVDIPNIPKELFQSELFGHNKGSFSGATDTKKGLFHQANKGTLFLDEIGDMSLDLQANLFIPIEEKLIRRVGSIQPEDLDIRFISATDKDLLSSMRDGLFREQLYHRLRECEIIVPPLRDRVEDIPGIVEFYLQKNNKTFNENKCFAPSTIEFLQEQNWPGNVRELASVIKVCLQTAKKEEIEISDIHKNMLNYPINKQTASDSQSVISTGRTLKEDLAEVDKRKIEVTLDRCKGNVSKSAAQLGISRETLHNKIRRYDIKVQVFRDKAKRKNILQ